MIEDNFFIEKLKSIGIPDNCHKYFIEAFTHSSYKRENDIDWDCNERLEFLGDSVIELVIRQYLYSNFKDEEGKLSIVKTKLVYRDSLADIAKELELGDFLLLGNGEKSNGGKEKTSFLENLYEAFIGACFLSFGFEKTKDMVLSHFKDKLINIDVSKDAKSELQEYTAKKFKSLPKYKLEKTTGPAHALIFEVSVAINSKVLGHGLGHTKKEAETLAAGEALAYLSSIK